MSYGCDSFFLFKPELYVLDFGSMFSRILISGFFKISVLSSQYKACSSCLLRNITIQCTR